MLAPCLSNSLCSIAYKTYLVVRIDGKGFHAFSDQQHFAKPNDVRALDLMNAAAAAFMQTGLGQEVFMAFGESDEYSFAFRKTANAYSRRARLALLKCCCCADTELCSKIVTTLVSLFTSFYVRLWPQHFPDDPLPADSEAPSFDGR